MGLFGTTSGVRIMCPRVPVSSPTEGGWGLPTSWLGARWFQSGGKGTAAVQASEYHTNLSWVRVWMCAAASALCRSRRPTVEILAQSVAEELGRYHMHTAWVISRHTMIVYPGNGNGATPGHGEPG